MYLRARTYVSGYEHTRDKAEKQRYRDLVESFEVGEVVDPNTPSAYVEFTVGYWRKANHIHQWFVEHCQDGVDDCRSAYVSVEQLRELRETCLRVLSLPTTNEEIGYYKMEKGGLTPVRETQPAIADAAVKEAEELLPTQSGFFFGETEYNHWYREDCKDTVKQIDRALLLEGSDGYYWDYVYQSSW